MDLNNCGPCREIEGSVSVPGGTIYENEFWLVNHRRGKYVIPGHIIIKLKRHCEQLSELTREESEALGPVIRRTCLAVSRALKPEKIHVASYGEGVKHIHFFVTPRTSKMPASNIGTYFYIQIDSVLRKYRIKKRYTNDDIVQTVDSIRKEFNKILDKEYSE